jgi:hypothetical protein
VVRVEKERVKERLGLWRNYFMRRGSQRFGLEVLPPVSKYLIEWNEMEDHERGLSRNDNRRYLRKKSLHRCLVGLSESSCTSPGGIYYRCGKVLLASTWGNEKRKSNIGRIDGIPLFVMPVVSLHTPFSSKQDKIA